MSIIRVKKRNNTFVTMSKQCLENSTLSFQARGLFAYLMGKPENWEIRVKHLVNESPAGRDAIYKILGELKDAGHIRFSKTMDPDTGKFSGGVYEIFEEAIEPSDIDSDVPNELDVTHNTRDTASGKPGPGKPGPGLPDPVNPEALINNEYTKQGKNKEGGAKEGTCKERRGTVVELGVTQASTMGTAAAVVLPEGEMTIRTELSETQMARLQCTLANSQPLLPSEVQGLPFQTLCQSVELELLSSKSFPKCQQDFDYKLNAIMKQLKSGHWNPMQPLHKHRKDAETALASEVSTLEDEITLLKSEWQGLYKDLERFSEYDPDNTALLDSFKRGLQSIEETISTKVTRIQQLTSSNTGRLS